MGEERVRRRLAAILAADVVGYSRLMGQDETGTLARLKALRRELLDPQIRGLGGRIVKLMAVGNRLDLVGEAAAGIAQMEKSLQLNPRDPIRWRYMSYLARAYISLGDYETAAEWGEKSVLLRPESPDALFRQAVCLAHLDRVEEARALLDRCEAIKPGFVAHREHWRPYSDQQRNEHLLAGLRRHGLVN